jgi:hypothetical protein
MMIYHIDMVILDIDMGYGLMIWEMTVSIVTVMISHIDMGYLVTLPSSACCSHELAAALVAARAFAATA